MDELINQALPMKIIEVEGDKERLVFSAKKAANDRHLEEFNVSNSFRQLHVIQRVVDNCTAPRVAGYITSTATSCNGQPSFASICPACVACWGFRLPDSEGPNLECLLSYSQGFAATHNMLNPLQRLLLYLPILNMRVTVRYATA